MQTAILLETTQTIRTDMPPKIPKKSLYSHQDSIRFDSISFLSQCNAREIRAAFPGQSEQP